MASELEGTTKNSHANADTVREEKALTEVAESVSQAGVMVATGRMARRVSGFS